MMRRFNPHNTLLDQAIRSGGHLFRHRLLSNRCLACLAPAESDYPLCKACEDSLALNHIACRQCAEPLVIPPGELHRLTERQAFSEEGWLCPRCQKETPPFTRTVSPFLYSYPLDRFVHRFKQDKQMIYGRLLSRLMADRLSEHYGTSAEPLPDLISAVPTHRIRRFRRGFNPAALLADEVSGTLKRPFYPGLCQKIIDTPVQHTLSRKERFKNLENSFRITRPVTGKTVAIVDDVMTTGATARVIARLLRDNGARDVVIWTLARTPHPEHEI